MSSKISVDFTDKSCSYLDGKLAQNDYNLTMRLLKHEKLKTHKAD